MAVREMRRPRAWKIARFTTDYTAEAGKLTVVTVPLEAQDGWKPVAFSRIGLGSSDATALHGFHINGLKAQLYVTNATGKDIASQTATVDVLFMPA